MTSTDLSTEIRKKCLKLCYLKKASHIGGAYSIADVLAVLYTDILTSFPNEPKNENRDRLFYSKGHACTALYSVLELKGFFANLENDFTKDGTYFTSHVNHNIPGVELSTGSLGHALSVSCGSALAAKRKNANWKVYTIISDGELDEGSNWESILFAPHHNLDNLCLIIDYNKIQSFGSVKEVLDLHPLKEKFQAFNWNTIEIDGHNENEIRNALLDFKNGLSKKPTVIICHTTKGKGVSFMENQLAWHYKSPNEEQYYAAMKELSKNA